MTFDTAEMTARHVADCRRLAELAKDLAVEAHACVKAAGTPEQKTAAIAAFHRASRSARQSMALEAMLVRRHLADLRGEAEEAERREAVEEGRVRGHVRAGGRLIWHEAEHEQEQTWAGFLNKVAADEEEKLKALCADPPTYESWLQRRFDVVRDELDIVRAALARGEPPPAFKDGLFPTYGLRADSS